MPVPTVFCCNNVERVVFVNTLFWRIYKLDYILFFGVCQLFNSILE